MSFAQLPPSLDISVRTQTTIFNSILVISLVLLTAVLLPALISRHVYRMRIWYALICSAIVYCVSFFLLVGYQMGPGEPPFGLCVAQTVMIYAAPVLVVSYALSLSMEAYSRREEMKSSTHSILIIFPLFVYVAIIIEGLVLALTNKNQVERDPTMFYCHVRSSAPAVVITVEAGIMIIVEGILLYQHERQLRRRNSVIVFDTPFPISLFIRKIVYTMNIGFALGLYAFILANPNKSSAEWSLLLTGLPLVTALIFGPHRDIIRFWVCRRPNMTESSGSVSDSDHDLMVHNFKLDKMRGKTPVLCRHTNPR
ncbi:uncharacterized protein BT62DRAFT_1007861 [Guyanagaster necrorhizus]|uniref:Uncharacterized protein n=1 Tax=Guyanagaster necrorhizus TaxID=856835 RepID=A0A9P7VQH3_9AGAR|nr:uncharacterized protein BT62DRAFT_1007861 [Guyanagaster necrorhizus MCA 3950]KAG7444835.1 hypothetical protein BT62DRAFT_1007861 [Guyanagaster necrorhizus MCA 3950]